MPAQPQPQTTGGTSLKRAHPKPLKKKWLYAVLVILILITLVWAWPRSKSQLVATNYKRLVCPDSWQHDVQQPSGNHFTVKLHEGCFSGFIRLPKGWHEWNLQQVGNDPTWWDAFWFEGATAPEGPFGSTAKLNFAYHPAAFRLQGKEGQEILFYTSDTTAPSTEATPGTPSSAQTGYEERFCNLASENEIGDLSAREIPDFQVDLHAGCFSGPIVLPRKGWGSYHIDKSQNPGDWATVWCKGRSHPSQIYPFSTDFSDDDFKGCSSFYLQGKGSVIFKGLS